jgi:hypothetical protein
MNAAPTAPARAEAPVTERLVFSPEEIEPDAAIDVALADTFEGFDRGRTFYGDLGALSPMRVDASPGRCYAAALVVENGGRMGASGRARAPILQLQVRQTRVTQTRVSQRVLYLEEEICVVRDGQLEILFEEEVDGTPRRAFEAGRGAFKLYVYERPRAANGSVDS